MSDFRDGWQPGRGQTGPHTTQQGAATPGQGDSLATGNVAEPQLGPGSASRAERQPSHLSAAAQDVYLENCALRARLADARRDLAKAGDDLHEAVRQRALAERTVVAQIAAWLDALGCTTTAAAIRAGRWKP